MKADLLASELPPQASAAADELSRRLEFFKNLQLVTNKIHATAQVEEIVDNLARDICALFQAERMTLYIADVDHRTLVSKVKTGLDAFRELRLPISDQSVAGHVALHRRTVNIRDVYDEAELQRLHPKLHALKAIDRRSGFRSREMLASPIIDSRSDELLGVIQLINHRGGGAFERFHEEGVKALAETLAIVLLRLKRAERPARRKFDYLIIDGVLTADQMDAVGERAHKEGIDFEEALIAAHRLSPATLGKALAKFFNVPYEPFKPGRSKPENLLKNLRREYVEQNLWLPIEESKDGIVVLAVDPEQLKSSHLVNNIFPRRKIEYRVTTKREFWQTVEQFYGVSLQRLLAGAEARYGPAEAAPSDEEADAAQDNEIVKLVNQIIVEAWKMGASDIHLEPGAGQEPLQVRFRRDGTLHKHMEIPASQRSAVVARIKIMCDLDISEKRKPQDGKIAFKKFAPLDIELRVATLPTAGGVEDVVMRILAGGEPMPLEKLGLSPQNEARLRACIEKPYGMFIVCGPTGSGKTTTLHSILKYLNTPERKIWTVEDPVEITQKGLRQVQVNKKAGIDFATVMRAFLRADPDVIMVGEMRDAETTHIGIEASLTGHLVFATLHTNSAPESVVRLLDMGMDPFNFADALLGILAQRLAKRLCEKCKRPYVADANEIRHLLNEYCEELQNTESFRGDPKGSMQAIYQSWLKRFANEKGQLILYRPTVAAADADDKCEHCGGSGYRGRIGLHELMVGNDAVKRLIVERARVAQLLAQALEDGMRTLKQDGIEKVLQGHTDMKQVRAVCIK